MSLRICPEILQVLIEAVFKTAITVLSISIVQLVVNYLGSTGTIWLTVLQCAELFRPASDDSFGGI